jgi:transposase InsO family protein
MAWGAIGVMERKAEFVLRANRGEQMTALCREFKISRPTGYLWKQRFQQSGLEGLQNLNTAPRRTPTRIRTEVEQTVVSLRQAKPDWGARKLRRLLEQQELKLPASTIHRVLLRHHLVAPENRHPPALKRFQRDKPNELWQMDFKGPQGWNQPTGPLSVLDDHSRFALALAHNGSTQAEAVKEQLQQVFQTSGVPEQMLMDHGTPWWNMQSLTGWTWLTVWLMKQNIGVLFCAYRHPQTQGKIERFHGTLQRSIRERKPSVIDQQWLDQFREEYNQVRPHEALGMTPPAQHWHKSPQAYEPNPQWTYPEGSDVYQLDTGGQLWWHNRRWQVSRALASETIELKQAAGRVIVFYRNTAIRELDLQTSRPVAPKRAPAAPTLRGQV